jgi:hypothetical protein
MTAPEHFILAGTSGVPPRRPAADCEDFGGLLFANDVIERPDPNEHLAAQDFKQVEMCLQSMIAMTPMLRIDATSYLGSPTIDRVLAANPALTTTTVTIVRNSTGNFTIAWPDSTMPSRNIDARVYVPNGFYALLQGSGYITLSIYDSSHALIDSCVFSVDIFGA